MSAGRSPGLTRRIAESDSIFAPRSGTQSFGGYHFDFAEELNPGPTAVGVRHTGRTVLMQFGSNGSSHRFDTRLARRAKVLNRSDQAKRILLQFVALSIRCGEIC